MKHFNEYFFESLSNDNIKRLEEYISDENIDEILKLIKHHSTSNSADLNKEFIEFFGPNGKNLSKFKWGKNKSVIKVFVDIFKDNYDKLVERINKWINKEDYVTYKDLSNNGKNTGNIYDFCKGWEEEAQEISELHVGGSANVGDYEILLKYLIDEGTTGKYGDVWLRTIKDDGLEMEVKKVSSKSGARIAGQKGDIHKSRSIYQYLYKELFKENEVKYNDLFRTYDSIKDHFESEIKSHNCKINDILICITKAIFEQYNKEEHCSKEFIENVLTLNKHENIIDDKLNVDEYKLLDMIGVIQLYCYSLVENFDIIFIVYSSDKNANNGTYVFLDKKTLLDVNNTYKVLTFSPLESPTTTQGRTGKMYIRSLKKGKK